MGWRDFLNAFKGSSVLLLVRSRTQPDKATEVSDDEPLPVRVVGGSSGGGGGSDPDSAREATLQAVRDRLPVPPTAILGRQTLTLTNAPQSLNVPTGATGADFGVRGGSASVAFAAPAPTATTGRLLPDGGSWHLEAYELSALRAVIASGAPVLDVTYVGPTSIGGSGSEGTTPQPFTSRDILATAGTQTVTDTFTLSAGQTLSATPLALWFGPLRGQLQWQSGGQWYTDWDFTLSRSSTSSNFQSFHTGIFRFLLDWTPADGSEAQTTGIHVERG